MTRAALISSVFLPPDALQSRPIGRLAPSEWMVRLAIEGMLYVTPSYGGALPLGLGGSIFPGRLLSQSNNRPQRSAAAGVAANGAGARHTGCRFRCRTAHSRSSRRAASGDSCCSGAADTARSGRDAANHGSPRDAGNQASLDVAAASTTTGSPTDASGQSVAAKPDGKRRSKTGHSAGQRRLWANRFVHRPSDTPRTDQRQEQARRSDALQVPQAAVERLFQVARHRRPRPRSRVRQGSVREQDPHAAGGRRRASHASRQTHGAGPGQSPRQAACRYPITEAGIGASIDADYAPWTRPTNAATSGAAP